MDILNGVVVSVLALVTASLAVTVYRLWTVNSRMRDELAVNSNRIEQAVTEVSVQVAELATAEAEHRRRTKQRFKDLEDSVTGVVERSASAAKSRTNLAYAKLEDLMALYRDIDPDRGLPLMHDWAAGPDLVRYLYNQVVDHKRSRVLECGSGTSTVILAYAMRALGSGHVVALEHDPHFAGLTRAMLVERGLSQWAEVVDAPLSDVAIEGETWRWYDPAAIPGGGIDLLVVDGPPGKTGPQARYPALPLLAERLSPGAAVVLDDARRGEEQSIGRRWKDEFDGFASSFISHDHGTFVLTRNADDED
jgi:predicted O-methyltransferase YrrM